MYRKIMFLLSLTMFSYNVCVFADAVGEKSDGEVDAISADRAVEMIGTGEKDKNKISNDEILKNHQVDPIDEDMVEMPDIVSGDTVSDNEDLEEGIQISDSVQNDEFPDVKERQERKEEANELSDKTVSSGDNEKQLEKEKIIKVSLPRNIRGYLDPGNIAERGGVYSDEYKIINYGNTDIVIKIKKINASYKDEEEIYEFSEDAVGDEGPDTKKINIDTVWKNKSENMEKVLNVADGDVNEYVLYLKASEYNDDNEFVRLNDGSVGLFSIRGTLNQNTDIQWSAGDISLQFSYKIQSVNEINRNGSEEEGESIKNALAA